jgi:anaerobic ribonucleoside-triphosphate reductase activating protein
MSPASFSLLGGRWAELDVIVQWLQSTGLRCLTISGGEPFDQAPALRELIKRLRAGGDWLITCYTGYRIESLQRDRLPGAAALVENLDLLIDGPYIESRHASLLWRGSDNQRIHNISGRVTLPEDTSAGVSVVVDADGGLRVVGVPPEPGFIGGFTERMSTGDIEPSSLPSVIPFHTTPYQIDQEV